MQKKYWLILPLTLTITLTAQARPVDSIIAKIGNTIITYQEALQFTKQNLIWKKIEGQFIPKNGDELFRQSLQKLIERASIDKFVQKQGITTSPAEINQSIQFIAKQNALSLKDFISSLEQAMENGYQFLQNNIKYQFLKSKIYNQIIKKKTYINEKKVQKLLNTPKFHPYLYQMQYIRKRITPFIDNKKSKAQKTQLLKNSIDEFKNGKKFETLSKKYSDSFTDKTKWLPINQLPSNFQKHANQLATNTFTIEEEKNAITLYRIQKIKTKFKQTTEEYKIKVIEMDINTLIGSQTSQEKMAEIFEEIKTNPEKFEQLANLWSENIETASREGLTDWLKESQLPTQLQKILENMKPKDISKPIATQEKIYIIKLVEKRIVDQFLKNQEQKARLQIEEKIAEQITKDWLNNLVIESTLWVNKKFQN